MVTKNKTPDGRITLLEKLGEGGLGVVYRGKTPEGFEVAVKYPKKPDDFMAGLIMDESSVVEDLVDHPNVVRFFESFKDVKGKAKNQALQKPYFVTELLQGQSLKDKIENSYTATVESTIKDVALPILDVMIYMHSKGMFHGDIKPGNIYVMPDGDIKVLDFGLTRADVRDYKVKRLGTPAFGSPEQLSIDWDKTLPITEKTDVYSLGATLYAILADRLPVDGDSGQLRKIKTFPTDYSEELKDIREFNKDVPDVLANVIMQSLEWDADKRPSASEFRKALIDAGYLPRKDPEILKRLASLSDYTQ